MFTAAMNRCSSAMKSPHHASLPIQTLLPLFCLVVLSTVFNAALTWNDIQVLSTIRSSQELTVVHGQGEVPLNLDQVAQLVEANAHYGMDMDDEWESLLPSNHASGIHLDSTSEHAQYISVYHQLSCLNALRKLYMNPGWEDDQRKKETAHHCLNILRQAVLCNGDTALEPSHPETLSNGKAVDAASGMDVLHVCRNWEQLRTLAEKDGFVNSHHSKSVQNDSV